MNPFSAFRKPRTIRRTANVHFVPSWKTTIVDGKDSFEALQLPGWPYDPTKRELYGRFEDRLSGSALVDGFTLTSPSARRAVVTAEPVCAIDPGPGYKPGVIGDVVLEKQYGKRLKTAVQDITTGPGSPLISGVVYEEQ